MSHADAEIDASPQFVDEARRQYRWLKFGLIALLVLACAFPLTLNIADPDLWGHVRYAQDWLAAGTMPRTATHTYTAVDYPWINHENAAELLFAVGFDRIGVNGMLLAKCLLGLSILATMVWTARRHGVPALSAWALMLLVATNMEAFFPLRPQLLSFAFCTLALVCLDRGFPAWPEQRDVRFAWLWVLPVLFVGWVNSHGGFMAGLCIVGALLLGRMVELLVSDGRQALPKLVQLAAIGLCCLAATLVNPYGVGLHQWLWETWGGAPPEIGEWRPPSLGQPVFWPFVTLATVSIVCLAATQQKRDWTQVAILALVGWQAASHLRHIAFVALLVGFWLPIHWQSTLARLRPNREQRLPIMLPSPWLRGALALGILAGVVLQSTALARRLNDLPVMRDRYPVDAIQFMADHQLKGKALVAFHWSQYALAALAPDVTVGFDGRFDTCYPQEAIDVHFDFLLGGGRPRGRRPDAGPVDGERALEYGQPDLVLFDRTYKHSADVMRQVTAREDSDWTLLYSDSAAELWGRKRRYDDPASPHYLPRSARRFDVKLSGVNPQWPALPVRNLPPAAAEQLTEL